MKYTTAIKRRHVLAYQARREAERDARRVANMFDGATIRSGSSGIYDHMIFVVIPRNNWYKDLVCDDGAAN